ncbi:MULTISPECIES: pseudouridine synthase [Actinomyces]|uniref:Pseudouridine synthase n=1 Tax=Actinomyces respiraculi TaxID=2744574 RepID=A0A7T0PW50_9ACTO|nr:MULTISPECIES: pseudouridine synthase [Actinomyces]QPL04475.1 rRNA pseudouridine synthase [Actinomyces respiraculi]
MNHHPKDPRPGTQARPRWDDGLAPTGELGAEEFYDEDDLEELDEQADADLLARFDAEAIGEDEEAAILAARHRAGRGGEADPHVEDGERLQKVLAHAGIASRRACENLIASGRVSVDGVVVTEVGVRVDPLTQEIRVDGTRVLTNPDVITVLLHKPAGIVTTMEDPQGRPTVAELAERYIAEHAEEIDHPASVRLVHVGRLDAETEGLILLSNDGELSHRLMHPSYEISKTYVAIVKGEVEHWVPRKLKRGIELEDGPAQADRVVVKDSGPAGSIVEITLHSGKNRIVRRMLEAVGHPVTRLARTRLGPLSLGTLKPGQMRRLSGDELVALQREVGL